MAELFASCNLAVYWLATAPSTLGTCFDFIKFLVHFKIAYAWLPLEALDLNCFLLLTGILCTYQYEFELIVHKNRMIRVIRSRNTGEKAKKDCKYLVNCIHSLNLCCISQTILSIIIPIQGDTLQSIKKDLDRVMQAGSFSFKFNQAQGFGRVIATLQFCTVLDPTSDGSKQHVIHDEWRPEKISNFVTQLGFHDQGDQDSEMSQQIKQLLLINEVCL